MNSVLAEKKLVILDRDGVINEESPHYIKSLAEWHPIPGSLEAMAALTQAGIRIAIVTNQSGIGRGLFTEAVLKEINDTLIKKVESLGGRVDVIFYCPHVPADHCTCRKPGVGLLNKVSEYFQLDLTQVPYIGDSEKDMLAAQKKQCQGMLVETGYGKTVSSEWIQKAAIPVYKNLKAAVAALLSEELPSWP